MLDALGHDATGVAPRALTDKAGTEVAVVVVIPIAGSDYASNEEGNIRKTAG